MRALPFGSAPNVSTGAPNAMLTGGSFDRLGVPPAFCEINDKIIP
jgi:hypothetical protein